MRKVIFVTAIILAVALAAFATESDPSNTVGFIKYQYISGPDTTGFPYGFTPFMLPFKYFRPGYFQTTNIDSIIGAQAADGDEVWNQRTGAVATYFFGVWYGGFPLLYTDAFWYNHPLYAPGTDVDITTAGEVNAAPINYGNIPVGFFAYGLPIVSPTACSSLELELVGLDPLEVWDQLSGGVYFYFFGAWYPDGVLQPGGPIWTNNTSGAPSPSPWIYDPTDDPGRGTTIIQTPAVGSPNRTQTIERAVPSTPRRSAVPSQRTH